MLAVVIVNWNDTAASIRALRSIQATEPVVAILVDNASADDPTAAVLAAEPATQVVRLSANGGYAAAGNHGVRAAEAAGATQVLVMNNDAELAPDASTASRPRYREHPGAVLAPLIV